MPPRRPRPVRLGVVGLLAAAALPLILIAGGLTTLTFQESERAIEAEELADASAAAARTRFFLREQMAAVHTVTLGPALRTFANPAGVRDYLDRLVAGNPSWLAASVAGGDGWNLTSDVGVAPRTLNASDRRYFRRVMETGQATVSEVIVGRRDQRTTVVVADRIDFDNGDRGVLVLSLSLELLGGLIGLEGRDVYIADELGNGAIHPGGRAGSEAISLLQVPGMQEALDGRSGVTRAELGRQDHLVAYAPVPELGWAVVTTRPVTAAFGTLRAQQALLATTVTVVVALVLVGAGLLAVRLSRALEGEARANEQALQALRERDAFVAGAAHDLKSPITAVQVASQLLERRLRQDSPDVALLLQETERVQRGARRMTQLIEDLVDSSRLAHGQDPVLRRAATDLGAVAGRAVESLRASTQKHELDLTAPVAPVMGEWDERQLTRVVENLVGNALKYSPAGTRVDVVVAERGDEVLLEVHDQGPGIPPEDRERIFRVYERGRNSGEPGSGLGLFITRRLVELHGGRLELESSAGDGSTFRVVLPRSATVLSAAG